MAKYQPNVVVAAERYNQLHKLITCSIILALLVMVFGNTGEAHATEAGDSALAKKLHIETSVGYNGLYAQDKGVPVYFKLTNELKRDLKGDLVLNIRDSRGTSTAHIMPLEISQGSTVEAHMTASGIFTKNDTWIEFYHGGVDRGEAIEITGTRTVEGQPVHSANVFGIVANDPDTLNFVAFFQNQGFASTPIVLEHDFYASTMHDLDMFTVLAINDVATADWPEEKINAIKDWVANGGTLLIGGGAGYSQTAAAFAALVPVEGRTNRQWDNTASLFSFTSSTEELQALTITEGRLVRGKTIIEDGDIPIVAAATHGNGAVYYVAFDLALKPFSVWEGRTSFVQSLLSERMLLGDVMYTPNDQSVLESASNFFPRLQQPKVSVLLSIFFLYILLVAPLLYVVLKRLDKREWSWWMIPGLAVLSTIIIIMIGTQDKSELYVHGIRVVTIDDDSARVRGINNIFIPNSKDITMEISKDDFPTFNSAGFSGASGVSLNKQQRIYHFADRKEVEFTNNKYWTMKSYMLQERVHSAAQYGKITAKLSRTDNDMLLTVQNETGKDLKHITLLAFSQPYYIADLASGEQLEYKLPPSLSQNTIQQGRYYSYSYGYDLIHAAGLNEDEMRREVNLLNNSSFVQAPVMLVAFSYDDTSQFHVNGKPVKSDELMMWLVDLENEFAEGLGNQLSIAPSSMQVERGEFHHSRQAQSYFTLVEGAVELKYVVPSGDHEVAEFLGSPDPMYGPITMQIYNVQSDTWESAPAGEFELEPYVDEWNNIKLKLESTGYYEGSLPMLLLDREVQS